MTADCIAPLPNKEKAIVGGRARQAIGLSYFKQRGFHLKTMETFGLGYSLEAWDAFSKKALEEGYSLDILKKAGLAVEKEEGRYFDRFRDRVMFPIYSITGKTIGFGARTLKKDKKQAKYLNSPESLVYHKSKVLYGLYQAKKAIRHEDTCYLVEGYTDVISLHQAGIENVVASSGTSLTTEQIRLIRRFSQNITFPVTGINEIARLDGKSSPEMFISDTKISPR